MQGCDHGICCTYNIMWTAIAICFTQQGGHGYVPCGEDEHGFFPTQDIQREFKKQHPSQKRSYVCLERSFVASLYSSDGHLCFE